MKILREHFPTEESFYRALDRYAESVALSIPDDHSDHSVVNRVFRAFFDPQDRFIHDSLSFGQWIVRNPRRYKLASKIIHASGVAIPDEGRRVSVKKKYPYTFIRSWLETVSLPSEVIQGPRRITKSIIRTFIEDSTEEYEHFLLRAIERTGVWTISRLIVASLSPGYEKVIEAQNESEEFLLVIVHDWMCGRL